MLEVSPGKAVNLFTKSKVQVRGSQRLPGTTETRRHRAKKQRLTL